MPPQSQERCLITALSLFPPELCSSLHVLFTGASTASSLQSIGEFLLPRVHCHLQMEPDAVEAVLGPVVSLSPLSCSVVGMLLQLDLALLYSAALHPTYLRSFVCEALYVLWLQSLQHGPSSMPIGSAFGSLYEPRSQLLHSRFPLLPGRPDSDHVDWAIGEGSWSSVPHMGARTHEDIPPDDGALCSSVSCPPLDGASGLNRLATHRPCGDRVLPLCSDHSPSLCLESSRALVCSPRAQALAVLSPTQASILSSPPLSVLPTSSFAEALLPVLPSTTLRTPTFLPEASVTAMGCRNFLAAAEGGSVVPWIDNASVVRLVRSLRSSAHRRKGSSSLNAELERSVRSAVSSSSPVSPGVRCIEQLRLTGARLGVATALIDQAIVLLTECLASASMTPGSPTHSCDLVIVSLLLRKPSNLLLDCTLSRSKRCCHPALIAP